MQQGVSCKVRVVFTAGDMSLVSTGSFYSMLLLLLLAQDCKAHRSCATPYGMFNAR